jgi:uncharacterized protein
LSANETAGEGLNQAEKMQLLQLARAALEDGVNGRPLPALDPACLSERLRKPGASFVTLTHQGALRGCIGAIEAARPLAEDVREHAVAAALQDYRFLPVSPDELPEIEIEISFLTPALPLEYGGPEDLLQRLRPGIDGVILMDGRRRATFLPQVWEKIPDPGVFLSYLCEKMGSHPYAWQRKKLQVFTYQVESFE